MFIANARATVDGQYILEMLVDVPALGISQGNTIYCEDWGGMDNMQSRVSTALRVKHTTIIVNG